MLKPTLVVTGATLALLAAATNPALAVNSAVIQNQDHCQAMMDQFNDAKTSNMEAIALAQKGWSDCGGGSVHTTEQGVSELEDALKLINVKPDYNYGAK